MPIVFVRHLSEDELLAESMLLVSASLTLLCQPQPTVVAQPFVVVASERHLPQKDCE